MSHYKVALKPQFDEKLEVPKTGENSMLFEVTLQIFLL